MDNGGKKSAPMPAPISHQNHAFVDPNQVEFLKSLYGNTRLDPDKVHPSLLQKLRELEKEDTCKNYFLDKKTSPDPNVRKDSSESSCMKEDGDSMSNQGDGQEMVPIEEEGSSNVSSYHYEHFKTQEKLFNHLDPNEKEKETSKSQETTKHMIKDEGNMDQGEFNTTFIPTWCLDASDDDFLCG